MSAASGPDGRRLRVLFVCDAGSPIAQSFIDQIVRVGHEAHVVSTYPGDAATIPGARSFEVIPVAFSGVSPRFDAQGAVEQGSVARAVHAVRRRLPLGALAGVRNALAPADVFRHAPALRRIVRAVRPDIVHAMRIPYEGMLAAEALRGESVPLVVSVWGNDFTLHASRSRVLAWMTKRTLARANALHSDCRRDLGLAHRRGFDRAKPALVLPGNGGLDLDVFRPGVPDTPIREMLGIPSCARVVVNPRGLRGYVRSDVFIAAAARVLAKVPDAVFVGVGMAGDARVAQWIAESGARNAIRVTPSLPREHVRDLFRVAEMSVSPSLHDGTPNSLLEAMACGALPVAGDIESVREWVDDGKNGLLFDPENAEALAVAVIRGLEDAELREQARAANRRIVEERANARDALPRAERLYWGMVRS